MQGLLQAGVGDRRTIQTGDEFGIGLPVDRNERLVEQRVFGSAAGGVEDEIGAVLAARLGGAVDQTAFLGLDADILRLALAGYFE